MGKTLQESKDEFNEQWTRLKDSLKDEYISLLLKIILIGAGFIALYLIIRLMIATYIVLAGIILLSFGELLKAHLKKKSKNL